MPAIGTTAASGRPAVGWEHVPDWPGKVIWAELRVE